MGGGRGVWPSVEAQGGAWTALPRTRDGPCWRSGGSPGASEMWAGRNLGSERQSLFNKLLPAWIPLTARLVGPVDLRWGCLLSDLPDDDDEIMTVMALMMTMLMRRG